MDTANRPTEPQQERQQQRSIRENQEELHSFLLGRDAGSMSTSNMNSLPQTASNSGGQPQESTSGVATAPKKKLGRPKKHTTLAPPADDEENQDYTADIAAPHKKRGPGRPRKQVVHEMKGIVAGGADEEGKDSTYVDPSERKKTPTKTPTKAKKRVTYEMVEPKTTGADEGAGSAVAPEEEQTKQTYVRPIARYVAPPEQEKPPGLRNVYFAFQREKMAYEEDPFSAYAFGGTRHRKPFRMLQNIGDPHEKDISGWAENLRWAHEQWKSFPDAVGNTGWNESPEQMDMIVAIREEQIWLSDELLAHLNKPEKKVKKKAPVEEMEY